MKTKEVIVTESGKLLVDKEDGFVVCGDIFKGDAQSGLFGNGKAVEAGLDMRAYTVEELLDGLCIDSFVLKRYAEEKIREQSNISETIFRSI